MRTELRQVLEQVAWRFRHVRLWSGLALCWLTWVAARPGLLRGRARSGDLAVPGAWLAAGPGGRRLGAGLRVPGRSDSAPTRAGWPGGSRRNTRTAAPAPRPPSSRARPRSAGRLGYLQTAVIVKPWSIAGRTDWEKPSRPGHCAPRSWRTDGAAPAYRRGRRCSSSRPSRAQSPRHRPLAARRSTSTVEPGNTELGRGTSLLVVARFAGAVPADASLVVENAAQRRVRRRHDAKPARPDVRRPRRVGRRPTSTYRVEFDGQSTETLSRPGVRVPRARAHRREARLPPLHVARAEDRRGYPPRHGRRGHRADPALSPQQGGRHGPTGR